MWKANYRAPRIIGDTLYLSSPHRINNQRAEIQGCAVFQTERYYFSRSVLGNRISPYGKYCRIRQSDVT